jgi:enolase-phosphatase E1
MTLNDDNKDTLIDLLVKHVYWQMDLDRKTKSLKQLQGNIWRDAYELGKIKG